MDGTGGSGRSTPSWSNSRSSSSSERRVAALAKHLCPPTDERGRFAEAEGSMEGSVASISLAPTAGTDLRSYFAHVQQAPEDPILGVSPPLSSPPLCPSELFCPSVELDRIWMPFIVQSKHRTRRIGRGIEKTVATGVLWFILVALLVTAPTALLPLLIYGMKGLLNCRYTTNSMLINRNRGTHD